MSSYCNVRHWPNCNDRWKGHFGHHGALVFGRRVRILVANLAKEISIRAEVLDVGTGDGIRHEKPPRGRPRTNMRASLMPCAISTHVVPAAERVRNRGSPIVPRSNIEIMGWLRKIESRTDAGSASHKLVCRRTRLRGVGKRWRPIACSTEPGIHRRR